MVDPDPAVALCAAGESAWHAAAHAGLGAPWYVDGGLARTDRFVHRYLLGAVSLVPRPTLPATVQGPVRDSYGAMHGLLDAGWRAEPADPWMLRPPGPLAVPEPTGVRVVRTFDPLLFEHAAFVGAGGFPPERPGELHPPGSEQVPGVHLFVALRADRPIGATLAVVSAGSVQVSAVGVNTDERGRGVASALVAAAVHCAPSLPATLASSAMAESTYTRLGFRRVGATPLLWVRV